MFRTRSVSLAAETPAANDLKQLRAAMRVLDALDRAEVRLNGHYERQRKHARAAFRRRVAVLIPTSDPAAPLKLEAYSRNVSQGGLSFIHRDRILADRIIIGMTLDETNIAWFHAEIQRRKSVQEGFWEYGVAFRERAAL